MKKSNIKYAILLAAGIAAIIVLAIVLIAGSGTGADSPEDAVRLYAQAIDRMDYTSYTNYIYPALKPYCDSAAADEGGKAAYMLSLRTEFTQDASQHLVCTFKYSDRLDTHAQFALQEELDDIGIDAGFSDACTVYFTLSVGAADEYDEPESLVTVKYGGKWYCLY